MDVDNGSAQMSHPRGGLEAKKPRQEMINTSLTQGNGGGDGMEGMYLRNIKNTVLQNVLVRQ